MKPKLRFPEFNAEWSNVILGDILDFKNGYNADKEDYGSGTPFINVSDILNNESIISSNLKQSVQISEHALKGFNVKKGDLLFQRSSETREEVGTVNVYLDDKIVTFGGFVIRGRLKSLVSTPYVLKLALSTATARNRITSKSGGSTRYNIGQDSLAEVAICVPTTQESERIESIFYLLSEKINLLTKKKQALEAYKRGLMQKIFSQELRFKREDGTDYSEWKSYKLNEVLIEHKMHSDGGEPVHSVSVHKGVVNQIEHLGRSFAAKNVSKYNKVLFGDVIYTKSPTGNFPYGIIKQSYVDNAIVSPLYCVTSPIDINIGYLLNWFFESNVNVHNYLHPIIQKGAKNTINISNDTFLSRSLFLPSSKAERRKIKEVYSSLNDNLRILESEIQKMTEFKKGLLQQMFV